jgi:hypothetical protein
MNSLKRIAIWAVIGTAALVAFIWWNDTSRKNEQESAARAQARKERAAHLLNSTKAETRVFDMQQGKLLVVDVPVPAVWSSNEFPMMETKRCMVWRDLETRTSAISCEADGDLRQ